MSDTEKVVDISAARLRKDHQRKEEKVDQLRDRFSKALGLEKKWVVKGGLWNFKQKKKKQEKQSKPGKPDSEGW